MNKPLMIVYGAVDTFSGYGARARGIAESLINTQEPEFDVRIISCPWGGTPTGYLQEDNITHKAIIDRILVDNNMPKQPEVFIMCTVANEMQKVGTASNILITAGVETHMPTVELLSGANNADLVIFSSTFGRDVFAKAYFDQIDQRTNQKISTVKLTSKTEVLFEGLDTTVYHKLQEKSTFDLDSITESFCFLTVGTWIEGEMFHDRKGIASLIKIFLESFKNKKQAPALILKTSGATPSIMDREKILDKIELIRKAVSATTLPNIYLLHGDLTEEEMNNLYGHDKVKAFALFGNEGYGRPYLEFSVHQKPIIASGYSGHMDFLHPEWNILVNGEIRPIHPSYAMDKIIPREGSWYYVSPGEASAAMKALFENYSKYLENAKRQAYRSRTEFSMEKMSEKFAKILKDNIPPLSQPISIKLPKLQKRTEELQVTEENK